MALGPDPDARPTDGGRPGVAYDDGVDHWTQIANEHWLKSSRSKKVKPDIIKRDIWDVLEKENFQSKSLLALENLQLLEQYAHPKKDLMSPYTNIYQLSMACLQRKLLESSCHSRRNNGLCQALGESTNLGYLLLLCWQSVSGLTTSLEIFADRPSDFSSLFRRILSMTLDSSLQTPLRTYLLSFIISAFQSLDSGLVRKECAPLVSIAIWHNLASDAIRDHKLERHGQLKRAWRAAAKRYDAADEPTKAKLRFERSWLYSLVLDFFAMLYDSTEQGAG